MYCEQKGLREEISEFATYLSSISTETPEEFDCEVFNRLANINEASLEFPESREALMRFCFESSGENLEQGYIGTRCRRKPAGYAGDYLIIDWLYTEKTENNSRGRLWDEFNHRQAAAKGVRSRKDYFQGVLNELCEEKSYSPCILNLASGPCRDVAEGLHSLDYCANGLHFHCVDVDENAVRYAQEMVGDLNSVASFQWEVNNVYKMRPFNRYDMVWVAGLFDYLNDKFAEKLLRKLISWTKTGGKIVFGNAHVSNPSRNYMDWCLDWPLIHRNEDDLMRICNQADVPEKYVTFEQEENGIWVFCIIEHIF